MKISKLGWIVFQIPSLLLGVSFFITLAYKILNDNNRLVLDGENISGLF